MTTISHYDRDDYLAHVADLREQSEIAAIRAQIVRLEAQVAELEQKLDNHGTN